eukprot:EG_transcript_49146
MTGSRIQLDHGNVADVSRTDCSAIAVCHQRNPWTQQSNAGAWHANALNVIALHWECVASGVVCARVDSVRHQGCAMRIERALRATLVDLTLQCTVVSDDALRDGWEALRF